MRINRKKFIKRIVELLIVIVTIILTASGIHYANEIRGVQAVGGEYLIPILRYVANNDYRRKIERRENICGYL